jgi:hypothetical protein
VDGFVLGALHAISTRRVIKVALAEVVCIAHGRNAVPVLVKFMVIKHG